MAFSLGLMAELAETGNIMDGMIARLYMESMFYFIVGLISIFFVFHKKRWVKWERMASDFKESVKKHEKAINIAVKSVFGICIAFMWLETVIPAIKDFPYVLQEDYLQAEGAVTVWDFSDGEKQEVRGVGILDENTKQEVFVTVYSRGIHEGEHLKIMYLPNSKYGTIIEKTFDEID